MGKKEMLQADLIRFRTSLHNLLNMQEDTHKASIAAGIAKEKENELYKAECKQRSAVYNMWKTLHGKDWMDSGYVRMPDGRTVKIDSSGLFFVCDEMIL